MKKNRGSKFVFDLISGSENIKIYCAGWIADNYTKNLIKSDKVDYLGVLPQEEINRFIVNNGDYLLAIYPTNNINNIYASPNKVYDSILTNTPLIINEKIKVSSFVLSKKIGYIIKDSKFNPDNLIRKLKSKKNDFLFDNKLLKEYCWEFYENILIESHI